MLRIHTQTDGQGDGLVELRELELLEQRQCFLQPVGALFDLLPRREVFLPALSHEPPPWCLRVSNTLPRFWRVPGPGFRVSESRTNLARRVTRRRLLARAPSP